MWKIGELAKRTGLTVRTLHHYDEIRPLSPVEGSDGGHRVYGEADVRRLYRIVSLRSLGFPLDAIAAALDQATDATEGWSLTDVRCAIFAIGFETFEDLRAAVRAFSRTFNERWLLERRHYRTPAQAREHLLRQPAVGIRADLVVADAARVCDDRVGVVPI